MLRSITLNITSGSDWLEKVKAGLFSGGMNPEELASDMERQASDSRTLKHNKDLEALEGKLAELENRMKGLESSRNEYADLDRRRAELKQDLDEVVSRGGVLQGEINAIEKTLELEDKIARRKDLTTTQVQIDKASTLQEELKNKYCAQPEVLNAISGLQQGMAELKQKESASQAEINMVQGRCREAEALQMACDKKIAAEQKTILIVQSLVQQIRDYSGNLSKRMKKVIQWNIPLLAAGIISVLICIILGVLVHWAFFIGIASALLVIPARRVKLVENTEAEEAEVRRIRENALNQAGLEIKSTTLDRIGDELQTVMADYNAAARDKQNLLDQVSSLRKEIGTRESGFKRLSEEINDIRGKIDELLTACGVRTDQELSAVLSGREHASKDLADIDSQLKARMVSEGTTDVAAYAADVRRRLADLDAEGVPPMGKATHEIQQLRNSLVIGKKERDRLREKETSITGELGKNTGIVEDNSGRILKGILETGREISDTQKKIDDMRLNKKAAAVAAEIFRSLAADSNVMLAELARELETTFGELLPEVRQVRVNNFTLEDIQVADHGKVLRPIRHLSRGTQDSFVFAARLTMAVKADPDNAKRLLVLDEPFYTFDQDRTRLALRMVRKVQDERGWQVMLFTKDQSLAESAKEILKNPVSYNLADN
jgi:DNA sulfur modification protein DndD